MLWHPSGALEWFPAHFEWDSFGTSWYEAGFSPSLRSFSLLPRFRHFVTDNPDQATHRQLRASSLSSHLELGFYRTVISLWVLQCVPLGLASKNSALILNNHVNYIKNCLTPCIPEFSWRDWGRTRNTTVSWFESRSVHLLSWWLMWFYSVPRATVVTAAQYQSFLQFQGQQLNTNVSFNFRDSSSIPKFPSISGTVAQYQSFLQLQGQ